MKLEGVTRIEIIDHRDALAGEGGRVFVRRDDNMEVTQVFQDDGKTLKIFLKDETIWNR